MKKSIQETINLVDGWIRDINLLQKEIAEINSAWITELSNLESDKIKEVGHLSKWLKEDIDSLPNSTVKYVKREFERQKDILIKEINTLKNRIESNLKESDTLEEKISIHRQQMEQENPEFDEREEQLKQQIKEALAVVKDLDHELTRYDSFRGWFNRAKVRKLNDEFEKRMNKLNRLSGRLEELREAWHEKLTNTDKSENEMQNEWASLQNIITEDKFELGHIEKNIDEIAMTNTVGELLDSRDSLDFPREQEEKLLKARRLKKRIESINEGIKRLASLIGAVNGVGKGLTEMGKSFRSLKSTQDRYSQLPRLSIEVPDPVGEYNSVWGKLIPKVKNEAKFIDDPTHLADEFDKIVEKFLSMESIKTMFDVFGDALKRSTAGWSA
jgi:chromosome segregation ATPase